MLSIQNALEPRDPLSLGRLPRIGLAVAGGGPVGGIYELGVLRALEDAIPGLKLTLLDVYVGVSSGAFIAAGLANAMSTSDMCRIFITSDSPEHRFRPEVFLRPAMFEYLRRVASMPRLVLDWIGDLARHPWNPQFGDPLGKLGSLIPTGLFDNDAVERFLAEVLSSHGRTNDFRELRRKLYIVAVELDTGVAVRFGAPGRDAVPISKAVQASSALPGLYPPVEIDGRFHVDGALRRTLHASVALDEDIDLLLAVNPLVPFDANQALSHGKRVPESLVYGGLPTVLSQTFRTMLQSRMQVGLEKYVTRYPHSDLLLFEPDSDEVELFFTNAFSFSSRMHVCDLAYRATLRDLKRHHEVLSPILERVGLAVDESVVGDAKRSIVDGLSAPPPRRTDVTSKLRRTLDELEDWIQRRARLEAASRS